MQTRAAALTLLLSALFAIGACSGPDAGSGGTALSGVTRLTEDLRIGVTAGAREYLFGSIDYIVQHPDGTTFIADRQAPIIRRYDAEGIYMHDVGGEGEGPGEYRDIQGMKLTPEGNLAIWGRVSSAAVRRPCAASTSTRPTASCSGPSRCPATSRILPAT